MSIDPRDASFFGDHVRARPANPNRRARFATVPDSDCLLAINIQIFRTVSNTSGAGLDPYTSSDDVVSSTRLAIPRSQGDDLRPPRLADDAMATR
jgi:hypothetical protein